MTDRYLWFAPYAGLWPSFRMEHRLADSLARSGRPVTMVQCGEVLDSYCPVMSADRLAVDSPRSAKRESCRDCRHNAGIARERAGYRSVLLDSYVTKEVREEATRLTRSVTPDTWADLEVEGIPVGRYAAYLSLLHHKVPEITATPAAWAEYRSDLRNALYVLGALPAMLADIDPTHVVVYNPLYPTNRMLAELARRHGIGLVGIHAGSFIPARYETVGVYGHISASQTLVDSPTVTASLSIPCTPAEVAAVGRHVGELVAGTDPWVYSSAPQRQDAAALRARLGLRPDAPVVVALLSSPDETRASMLVDAEWHRDPERGYSDISEFIRALRDLAASSPDIDVVLRLHPRLMPNKRETVRSPDLDAILAALAELPANAHVNAPADGVSLYDLVGIAAAAVNQSSSSGLEFLALGLPVVSFDPVRQNAYPPELGHCVGRGDPAALAAAVADAVASGRRLDRSVAAFRWYATVTLRDLLLLTDVVPEPAEPGEAMAQPADVNAASRPAAASLGSGGVAAAVRRLVPEVVRERGARLVARRSRAASLPTSTQDAWWRTEWLARLDSADAGGPDAGPVWLPPIVVRGEPVAQSSSDAADAAAVERAAVAAQVDRLTQVLGFDLPTPT